MAVIKVHVNPLLTASMQVLATVYEKEVDHEFVFVDMRAGEHKEEHFLSLNVRKPILLFPISPLFIIIMNENNNEIGSIILLLL